MNCTQFFIPTKTPDIYNFVEIFSGIKTSYFTYGIYIGISGDINEILITVSEGVSTPL